MNENKLREQVCVLAKSLYDRGLAHGSTGNISARCEDGGLLISPTNSSFGFLDPVELCRFNAHGQQISGPKPTKEMALHTAFYDTRGTDAGAVVHLHSHYSVALSLLEGINEDDANFDTERAQLREDVDAFMEAGSSELLNAMRKGLYADYPGGFGRTDALARIGNMVFGTEMDNPDNLAVGSALTNVQL